MISNELWDRVDSINGWLSREEADALVKYNKNIWCEIGCWKGKSTIVLASSGTFGYAIDWFKGTHREVEPTDTYKEFITNTNDFQTKFEVLTYRHEIAVTRVQTGLDLLYLDGDHSFEATASAFSLYAPKIKYGGHIIFHDAWADHGFKEQEKLHLPAVTHFVNGLIMDATIPWGKMEEPKSNWQHIEDVDRMAIFKRI